MVSFETFRNFEMDLTASLTCSSSKLKPRVNLVLNLTMFGINRIKTMQKNHWISLRTITSGSTHPGKKVEHSPVKEKCSM